MSLKPLIAGLSQSSSGGSSSSYPGLPTWTYTAGAMAAGAMKTNDANPAVTSELRFSSTSKNGPTGWGDTLQILFSSSANTRVIIFLTNSAGKTYSFRISGRADDSGTSVLTVVALTVDTVPGSGDYQVSFSLIPGDSLQADTGWTANGGVGDKTVPVQDYVNGVDGTMATALDVVSAGLGSAIVAGFEQLEDVTKKLQAIETALSTNLRPNA